VPDFVVAAAQGKIVQLSSAAFHAVDASVISSGCTIRSLATRIRSPIPPIQKRRGTVLVTAFDGDVYALDSHPSLPRFAVGTHKGTLQVWVGLLLLAHVLCSMRFSKDIDDRAIIAHRNFLRAAAAGCCSSNPSMRCILATIPLPR